MIFLSLNTSLKIKQIVPKYKSWYNLFLFLAEYVLISNS